MEEFFFLFITDIFQDDDDSSNVSILSNLWDIATTGWII